MFSRILKCIIGFIILCTIQYFCNWMVKLTHIILPAPILGIILLSLLIQANIIKKEWIKDICNLLLKNMPLLFVPIFVGLISYYGIIEKNLIPILVNVIIGTTLTIMVTGIIVDNIIKYIKLRRMRKLHHD